MSKLIYIVAIRFFKGHPPMMYEFPTKQDAEKFMKDIKSQEPTAEIIIGEGESK